MEFIRPELRDTASSFIVSEVQHRAKLDQNESSIDLPQDVKDILLEELRRTPWNRYPQPRAYYEAKEIFADAAGIPKDKLFIGMGADQMILTAYYVAGGAGRKALVFEPTYPMFFHYAKLTGTDTNIIVLGPEYRIEPKHLKDEYDLISIISPNNPTGNLQDREIILRALEARGMVFLDEAYGVFAGCTYCDLLDDHENLFVARSLSKTLLAGARIGYGVAHPKCVEIFEQIHTVPYHLNILSLTVVRLFPKLKPYFEEAQENVVRERDRLSVRMKELPLHVYESSANFILFKVGDANSVYDGLLRRGIRIRNVSALPGLAGHLRVTIGTHEENDMFLEALKEVCS
jgi:histidinol-phosphate aminotransferase